jgi:competence protein ComEA
MSMLRRFSTFLAGILTGLLSAGLLFIFISKPRGKPIELFPPPPPSPLRVHVAGAILHEGVYELPPGSITQQAIDAAGGPTEGAILEALNLAAPLEDGQQIYVPAANSTATASWVAQPTTSKATGELINVNTATAPELERLPGIGPSIAQKIIDCREEHGPFLAPDDLLLVSGIGPTKLDQIRDLITFR